jgi:vitamin B12/bleomycin/antimicrobial peptide transport system ATP-binding/permease protein
MLIYVGLAITDIVRNLLDVYLMQRFIIRWRVWLTQRLTGDWLDGDAYYRGRFVEAPIDNPDQRIQQDIDIFTTGTGPETNTPTVSTSQTLVFGSVFAIVNVVSFTPILWVLAGPLTIFGVTVPKALFWMAPVYVFFTTVVAFWIGRPLIRCPSATSSPTPRSAMRWCDYAMRPRPSVPTAAKAPKGPS